MTPTSYRLPNGSVPVLVSADSQDLLNAEAAALLSYAAHHPDASPQAIAEMLFRTRVPRRYRALAMVNNRAELIAVLRSVADGREHPLVVRGNAPASVGRLGYVFPGQGGQRPGMGRLFYESAPAFRAEADRCADVFSELFGESPLKYLLDEQLPDDDRACTVQPALFTQMAGLAAMWRSFGVTPHVAIGHSQGEIAAAYFAGTMTLADAVRVVGIRARAADGFATGDYAMAVIAAPRDACEDMVARCAGWAQLSVVNSPTMVGISGDRETVEGIVETFTERGVFARVIRVQYPAHTALMNELSETIRTTTQRQLENPKFLDADVECIGSTLGGLVTAELPIDEYWFLNLRNTVRFDKAIAETIPRDINIFVELSEHPTLQLAIQENLAVAADDRARVVVGTSNRTATDLGEFTRNLATLAVHDLEYSWESLASETDGPARLPLLDFPNIAMNEVRLWMSYDYGTPQHVQPNDETTPAVVQTSPSPSAEPTSARLLVEKWVRLSRRSLVPPRAIGIVDHTGECAELAAAMGVAAQNVGATARVVTGDGDDDRSDLDTQVILLPQSPEQDDFAAASGVADFFGNRTWWPGVNDTITHCWLVTVGGEPVVADDAPDPVHAAAGAGFRSVGAEHLGVAFRHLDLPSGSTTTTETANSILAALHTAEESELALRNGGLYAKRIVEVDAPVAGSETPAHVLIIGGTGHLGLEFCSYFAHRGARRITLVSRSGETAAVAGRLQQIRSATATHITVASCDVGDQAAVSRLATLQPDAPADVIIHAAVDYADIEHEDITREKVDQALHAKVIGISRVLATFPRTQDCRVVLCSSAAATIGGRGQVVYAAANRMLDAMAYRLRAEGVDCVSVQWGQWTVHLDLDDSGLAKVAGTGVVPMSPADALALGMLPFPENALVAAFDLTRTRWALEIYGYGPLLSQLRAPVVETGAAMAEKNPQRFLKLLAEAIGVDSVDKIDTTIPLVAIGLDSLQALEFRRRVQVEFDLDLAVADLLGGASVADVLARID